MNQKGKYEEEKEIVEYLFKNKNFLFERIEDMMRGHPRTPEITYEMKLKQSIYIAIKIYGINNLGYEVDDGFLKREDVKQLKQELEVLFRL